MFKKHFFIRLFLILALLGGAPFAALGKDCAEGYALFNGEQAVGPEQVQTFRKILVDDLVEKRLPAFLKTTRGGEVPVILVNNQTYPALKTYLDNSLGTQVYMQPNWNNDHGGVRVLGNLIDVDMPGARHYGELNRTGIAWKPIDSYLARGGGSVVIEVSYALTPEEVAVADVYHRVRRAAFYRVPFTFGGAKNDATLANMLQSGEHCFVFCKASAVSSHVGELQRLLATSGVNDPGAYLARPDVKEFLAKAKEYIRAANPNGLTPDLLLGNEELVSRLRNIAPPGLTADIKKLQNFGDALVGYDVTRDYQVLMRNLGATYDTGFTDMNNPRTTAVLIYDSSRPDAAFRNGTYQTPGKFSSWQSNGQRVITP